MNLHPEFIEKNGKRHVVLSYSEFEAVQDALEDLDDLRELRQAKVKEGDAESISLTDFKSGLE